jgi:hypothetical protein
MINNLPLRLTILHFAQRLRMDGPTFMIAFSLPRLFNQRLNYTCSMLIRPVPAVSLLSGYGTVRTRGSPSVTATECS